jgi:hypothetical protein
MGNSVVLEAGIPWTFTDKEVTAWGGIRLIHEMLLRLRFRQALEQAGLPEPGSNRGFSAVEMMESFLVCVWIGGSRFSHTALVRFDKALHQIFGWRGVASVSTFTRFFRRFKREEVDRVFSHLSHWFWDQISPRTLTLDLDSSVITRYGKQEGARYGYNDKHPGKPSHHPLFAFVADLRMVLHAWLRPGNTASCSGISLFFQEALELLGSRHRIGLVRADSGFYDGEFIELLESKSADYIIAVRMYRPFKLAVTAPRPWTTVAEGVDVAELEYHPLYWKKPRRMVVIRQQLKRRPDAMGKPLLEVPGHLFQAYVTSLRLPPAEVWRLYNGRGDAENRIAELKYDFGLTGFCLDPFYATETAFRTVILAYNLMSLFRQAILQAPKAVRLSTMRIECIALGAWIGREGRRRVLRLSLARPRRPWFEGLFASAAGFSPPWTPHGPSG